MPALSAPSSSRRDAIRNVAETLVLASAGGLGLGLSGFPAGYLSGAILVVAAAALLGRPMDVPRILQIPIYVLIGISLGAVVTPETLHGMASYPLSIAVLLAAMTVVSVAGSAYLQVVHGWDKVAAYLGSAPGGMSQVLILAADLGADLRAIAIVQSLRVVIVAVGLPAGLAAAGFAGQATRPYVPLTLASLDELAILTVASSLAAYAALRLRFPGGLMFGAMLMSAFLHGTGLIHASTPWWVANTAMIALGAIIGARFTNTPLRMLLRFLAAGIGSFAVAVVIAAVFAAGLISLVPLRIPEVMIAFAPGSVDAMMLLALALHLDPVYVGAHHVLRIFMVSLTMPLIARRVARKK
jgi:membrane AbrB-like protein